MGKASLFILPHPLNFFTVCDSPTSRILVVDDLGDNLFLLQTVLEAEGYEVDTADNGNLALAKVADSPPDLILMDVTMPDMNGYEVTQQIRQNSSIPFIPILLVTAHEDAYDIQGLALGANDFIRKPIEFDKLLVRIKAFLQFKQNACSP
ncbi:MAG TPA: response regulator [Leptolyngbyaceae cyanobacterium M33_DOE_097]|uniref:Response regulator n=1 Tax=Oscillatoriales cyanobacterium SpSt-418 TaxID=2282169 RepID=A0A7C3KEM5_9CYAN|nr:response regulator [Leptolyngbyaceae cyanobacterium M33_DOE_097]